MKKSSPISLFSFQDIITCLTGIMIVVVLVILLQLVESTAAVAARAQLQPEYLTLKKHLEELIERRDALKRKLAEGRKQEKDEFQERSEAELKSMAREERRNITALERKVAEAERAFSALHLEVEKQKLRLEQSRQELRNLAKGENELLERRAQLMALQKRQNEVTEQIERKRRMLRFEFVGVDDQIPLLVECTSWGFRAKRHPDGEVVSFGDPKSPAPGKQLPALMAWLQQQNLSRCYPVLLFHEEALPLYNSIIGELGHLKSDIAIGKELVATGEECF